MATNDSDVDNFDTVFLSAVNFGLLSNFQDISDLKLKQEEALYSNIKRIDVLAVLPTGKVTNLSTRFCCFSSCSQPWISVPEKCNFDRHFPSQ